MRIIYNENFSLLRRPYGVFSTMSYEDTVIVPAPMYFLMGLFFDIDNYDDATYTYRQTHIVTALQCKGDELYYAGELLTSDINWAHVDEFALIKGYIIVIITADSEKNLSNAFIIFLVVLTLRDFKPIGFLSNGYGNRVSGEMANLILTTPEFKWEVS